MICKQAPHLKAPGQYGLPHANLTLRCTPAATPRWRKSAAAGAFPTGLPIPEVPPHSTHQCGLTVQLEVCWRTTGTRQPCVRIGNLCTCARSSMRMTRMVGSNEDGTALQSYDMRLACRKRHSGPRRGASTHAGRPPGSCACGGAERCLSQAYWRDQNKVAARAYCLLLYNIWE